MRINKITAAALIILVLAAINILFFAWTDPETRGAVEWMSYGFTMFSFIVACIAILRRRGDDDEVYNLTTAYLPTSYFVVQTILSAIAIYYGMVLRKASEAAQTISENVNVSVANLVDKAQEVLPDSIQGLAVDSIGSTINETVQSTTEVVAQQPSFLSEHYTVIVLSVYILVFVFYAFNLAMHSTANKATEESLARQQEEHSFIQENSQRLQRAMLQIKDPSAKKAVNSLFETIRFGANHTTPEGKVLQEEVTAGIGRLIALIGAADWDSVKELANELNTKAKLIKQ